ncbi:zinc finger and BTB domain-containing protein 11 [Hippoglossus stenolepis]|uniref:zinc finger and BTB domain-containing protein 11 n=1 Tax=Hippoglossus stenolepis TaxID=195615 RepID=UPI001FAFEDD7|nr:zinc finger and BTB domain-containing protein 11 [Hippoglossus stenolepis]
MSCEESYLAIIRYLTDEQEPYAPGTPGNTKRKIRKAAACYVVRSGTLFYQRRLKGQDEFTELEVVLQDDRRRELIKQAHIMEAGEHLNQQLTWEYISQKYWWRAILKHVKDFIRECPHCLSKRAADDGSGPRPFSRSGRRRAAANANDEEEEDEPEEVGVEGFLFTTSSSHVKCKTAAKHELVFVDSKGEVNQYLPKHSQTILDKLNQQRLSNQFCDITLLIEGEEYRAHKAVLAACSEYFHELFFEKGAVSTHEAVVDLSGFSKVSFLPLLDFAYTSTLTFNFCIMAEIANLARHLLMNEVLLICESVHKQVEEQKLTVYQRGDVHTVVSSQPAPQEILKDESEAYIMALQDGVVVTQGAVAVTGESLAFVAPSKDAFIQQPISVVTDAVEGDQVDGGEAGENELVSLIAHSAQAEPGETVTLISRSAEEMDGETMTVVTHSGQAGASESLAVVSACLAMEQPQVAEAEAFVINMDTDSVSPTEVVKLASAAAPEAAAAASPQESVDPAPIPQKRKRGRPAKVKKEVEEEVTMPPEEEDPSADEGHTDKQEMTSDDPSKRRLRQRSIAEGGYARLHMGLEEEEEGKKSSTPPRAITPKVGPRPGKRGRPPKHPVESQVEGASESGAEPETGAVESVAAEEVSTEEAATMAAAEAETRTNHDQSPTEGAVEGEYTCTECGMSFQRRYSLIMHSLKHEKAFGYKCSLCSKEFQYAASLRAHLTRHKQQRSQRVPITKLLVKQSVDGKVCGDMNNKTLLSHTKREFVCDICGKTLPKLYSLRIHMLTHTGVRPHSCKICGKTFAHKHSLKMHWALHDVTKQFQCEFCKKYFVSKRGMEEHTSLHTGESKYLCNTCGATFFRASALSKHMKKHQPKPDVRPIACTHCDKRFYEAKDLQQHMNKHLGLKPFQCQVCGKCYSWKKDWYSHVKSHSVAEPYKCNVCGKEFFEKALFRRHVKKATHGKKGRVKQNLERECEQCGRKFTQLREYRRHINNHQGVKPFECLTCGVAWADARSLKRHVRTHTGERPYVCPMCQEAHIDARTLRKHMAKYHSDNLPGKIMLEKDTLQFHNQGTQVEHAVSILASDLPPELRPAQQQPSEEIETVLITEETVEAGDATQLDGSVATLSDQGIMQVVNYVLAQQALTDSKLDDAPEMIQTMEVEVAHVAEVE